MGDTYKVKSSQWKNVNIVHTNTHHFTQYKNSRQIRKKSNEKTEAKNHSEKKMWQRKKSWNIGAERINNRRIHNELKKKKRSPQTLIGMPHAMTLCCIFDIYKGACIERNFDCICNHSLCTALTAKIKRCWSVSSKLNKGRKRSRAKKIKYEESIWKIAYKIEIDVCATL